MSFALPLLLAGLGAIAIPVVLHLMAREVPKTVHFPTLRFITRDKLETHSKRGIRDLLLLLMRCLIIAGVVLAFAHPFVEKKDEGVAVADQETVILFDASVSMNREGVLDSVREKAADMIKDGESVGMIVSGSSIFGRFPYADKKAALENIGKIKLSLEEGHHEAALNDAVGMFNKKSKKKKLIIVSDFRQNDWTFNQVPQVGKEVEIKFLNPFSGNPDNVAVSVDRVRRMSEGKLVQIQVRLQNQSAAEKDIDITFTAGQKKVQEKVHLNGLEKRRVVLTMENPASSKAVVQITGDDYPFDDTYHLWIGDEAPINVVFPEKGEQDSLDYIFVKKALQDVKAGDASFRVTAVDADLFSSADLEEAQALILTDRALSLPADQYETIKKFAEEGGLIIAAPGEKAGVILSRLKTYGLADVSFQEKIQRKSRTDLPFRFHYRKENSPLLKLFADTPDSDIQNFAIYSYNQFTSEGKSEILLGFSEEIPGWAVNPLGKGHVIVSAIPFNHIWSDFTLSNSFLPLLRHSIITYSGNSEKALMNLKIGEKKVRPGETAYTDDNFIDTKAAGCSVINEIPVVVNVSRVESNTEAINFIDLKNRMKSAGKERVNVVNEKISGTEYWHLFILLALLALFGEFIIADLFRRPSAH